MPTAEDVLVKHCPSFVEKHLDGKEKKFKQRIIAAMEFYAENYFAENAKKAAEKK